MTEELKYLRFTISRQALMDALGLMDLSRGVDENTHCFFTSADDGLHLTALNDSNSIGAHVQFNSDAIRWYHKDLFFVGIECKQLDLWLRTIKTEELYVSVSKDFIQITSGNNHFKQRTCTDDYRYVTLKFHKSIQNVHTYKANVDLALLSNCISTMECYVDYCHIVPKKDGIVLSSGERCGVSYDAKQYDASFWIPTDESILKSDLWNYSTYSTDLLHTAITRLPYNRLSYCTVAYGKDVPIEFAFEQYGGKYSIVVVPMLFYS